VEVRLRLAQLVGADFKEFFADWRKESPARLEGAALNSETGGTNEDVDTPLQPTSDHDWSPLHRHVHTHVLNGERL
jgi:hypothetical protein